MRFLLLATVCAVLWAGCGEEEGGVFAVGGDRSGDGDGDGDGNGHGDGGGPGPGGDDHCDPGGEPDSGTGAMLDGGSVAGPGGVDEREPFEFDHWGDPDGPPVIGPGAPGCGVTLSGKISCWELPATSFPGDDYIGVDCGYGPCCAQRANGQIVVSGGFEGHVEVPVGRQVLQYECQYGHGAGVLPSGEGRYWKLADFVLHDEYGEGTDMLGKNVVGPHRTLSINKQYDKLLTAVTMNVINPAPELRFKQIKPAGCAITDDGKLVFIDNDFNRTVRDGPPGKYTSIVQCGAFGKQDDSQGDPVLQGTPVTRGEVTSGIAIRDDGKVVQFEGDSVSVHPGFAGNDYWKGAHDSYRFLCVLTHAGKVECEGDFDGYVDPEVYFLGPEMELTYEPELETFTQIAGGGGLIWGTTRKQKLWFWGDQGGNLMKPKGQFP